MAPTSITLALIALLLTIAQIANIRALSRTHFDNLAPAALRRRMRLWSFLRLPCALIALDIRKMHDMNGILGYAANNGLVCELVSVRQHRSYRHPWRWLDLVGQWSGGDEFLIALADPAALPYVIARIEARLTELTTRLSPAERALIMERTGGLVDGLHAAIVSVPYTRDAYSAAILAVDATGRLKEGAWTGSRSTSGAVGTVRQVLA